ncbi:hypothetical protein K439DRAFT_1331778 [Ramaria rubella]|nr:hypothetical protein K439DRAFT_1331778 [Ramaria rubella]
MDAPQLLPSPREQLSRELPLSPIVEVEASVRSFQTDKDDLPIDAFNPADGPPSLGYPIQNKKRALVSTWSIIILMNTILPVTIFYVLRHGKIVSLHLTHSSTDFILNISQIPMTPTLFQFPYRLWQLKRRNGERSPRDRGRFTWDFFQWQFLFGALLTTAVCAVAGVRESYKIFALAPPILFSEVCLQLLVLDLLSTWKVPQPCRMSSVPKGAPFRPGVYYIIEDLTAVDGGAGTAYRDRLSERWNRSPPFQLLVRDVGRILGFSGLLMVGVELALILMTPADLFYGASWVILWVWAALSAYFCISYTKACLVVEKDWWQHEVVERTP